jgi:hypothetical protein
MENAKKVPGTGGFSPLLPYRRRPRGFYNGEPPQKWQTVKSAVACCPDK